MKCLAESVGSKIDVVFLPMLTAISGVMGVSKAVTHEKEIHFSQPSMLWTITAAEPGKLKKKCILICVFLAILFIGYTFHTRLFIYYQYRGFFY